MRTAVLALATILVVVGWLVSLAYLWGNLL